MSRANVKDKRKSQLIAAALESIAKRGLMETTITHISKGAGMSRGIINFYFTSKEMMLRETLKTLIDEYETEWGEALARAGDTGRGRLNAVLKAHFDKKLCSARRLNVMSAFWGHAASQSAYRAQLEAADARIETALTQALAHALASSLEDARHAATQLHALIRGLWLNFMLNPQTVSREVLLVEAMSFVDRLAGAPIRIVKEGEKPAAVKARAGTKPKADEPKQLDIEDLFGNRA